MTAIKKNHCRNSLISPNSSGWLDIPFSYIYFQITSVNRIRSYDSYMVPDLLSGIVKMIFGLFVSIHQDWFSFLKA